MNKNLQHETSKFQQLAPAVQCSSRSVHAEQAHWQGCAAVEQWVAGAEGSEGTLGPHGTADLPIVQAEQTDKTLISQQKI